MSARHPRSAARWSRAEDVRLRRRRAPPPLPLSATAFSVVPTIADSSLDAVLRMRRPDSLRGKLHAARAADGAMIAFDSVGTGERDAPRDAEYSTRRFAADVVAGVGPESTIVREEVFGPVLAVYTFTEENQAVAYAADSPFGLAGAVWTRTSTAPTGSRPGCGAGTVWVNAYRVVAPSVPFGGFGHSGIGRENGIDAITDYTETKSVWVELSGGTRDPFTLG